MSIIIGNEGCVRLTDGSIVVADITEWSLDYVADIFDVTVFAETAPTHKSQKSGVLQATGSFTGNITDGATGILGVINVGSSLDLHLEADGDAKYDIPVAVVSGVSTSVSIGGNATVTCNFTSSGTVTPLFS